MNTNPYQAPESDQTANEENEVVSAEILKKIQNGFYAAIMSGVLTALVTIFFVMSGSEHSIFNVWNFIDVALVFVLAYGIYRKSRTAATFMFLYFVASKIMILAETGGGNLIISLIFLYYFFHAMIGTFQYQRILKAQRIAT